MDLRPGVALLLLAVVGIVSLVSAVGNRIASAMQNDSELRAWDDFLQPVVLMDPAPFDEIAAADAGFLRDASVWGRRVPYRRGGDGCTGTD